MLKNKIYKFFYAVLIENCFASMTKSFPSVIKFFVLMAKFLALSIKFFTSMNEFLAVSIKFFAVMIEFLALEVKFFNSMADAKNLTSDARNLAVEKCDFKILWKGNSVCIFAKCDGVNDWNKNIVIIICGANKAGEAGIKKLLQKQIFANN